MQRNGQNGGLANEQLVPRDEGFPETPAGTIFEEPRGTHSTPLHFTPLHSRRAYCDLFCEWKNMNNPASVPRMRVPTTPYLDTSISTCSKGHVIERACTADGAFPAVLYAVCVESGGGH